MVLGFDLTTCIICGRALSNPDSVDLGIGPICGARAHVESGMPADVVREANGILAELQRDGLKSRLLDGLADLGYVNLASAVTTALADFSFSYNEENTEFVVSFRYDPRKVDVMRGIRGRRWYDSKRKAWIFPNTDERRATVRDALQNAVSQFGTIHCTGPKGHFTFSE